MMGLPSLQAMDRAQGARIWMASEATDMRCKESIESNPGLTIRLRPFFSRISTLASPDEIPSRDCQCNATLLHPDRQVSAPSTASKTTRTLRSRISILIAALAQARLRRKSLQIGCLSKAPLFGRLCCRRQYPIKPQVDSL